MLKHPATFALALLAMLGGLVTTASPAHADGVQYGFNAWTPAYGAGPTLERQKALGNVPVRRMFVYWNEVQAAGATSWRWDIFDRVYANIVGSGLKPHLVLHGVPCWARPTVPCEGSTYVDGFPPPTADSAWKKFVGRTIDRYPAASVDVWNEANMSKAPDPKRYTALLKMTYPLVKRSSPTTQVISTGLAVNHVDHGNWSSFLRTMLANGAAPYLDGIGLHAYPTDVTQSELLWSASPFEPILDAFNRVQAEFGVRKPLWVIEAGCGSTVDNSFFRATTPEQQAVDCDAMINIAARRGDVRAMFFHTLDDAPASMDYGWTGGFGMYDEDGRPKPAACAISARLGGRLAC